MVSFRFQGNREMKNTELCSAYSENPGYQCATSVCNEQGISADIGHKSDPFGNIPTTDYMVRISNEM